MIRIVIDARPAEKKGFGIARYTYELLRALIAADNVNSYILLVNTENLGELINNAANFSLYKIKSKWMGIREQIELPWVLYKIKPDLFHATSFVVPYILPCKTVVSILDLIHLAFPGDYSWAHRLYYHFVIGHAVENASAVITISEYSKRQIVKHFNIPEEKVTVTYLAPAPAFHLLNGRSDKTRDGHYILAVGSPKPHKNILTLIKAYNILRKDHRLDQKLMIVGVVNDAVKNEAAANNIAADVEIKVKLSDNEMNDYYSAADVFVCPSLCEGFGLPVLEAMACGAPVVASNTSSLPEVVGEAGLLIDPDDAGQIAGAIRKIQTDQKLKEDLIKKGQERVKQFTWGKCAKETLAVYREAVSG